MPPRNRPGSGWRTRSMRARAPPRSQDGGSLAGVLLHAPELLVHDRGVELPEERLRLAQLLRRRERRGRPAADLHGVVTGEHVVSGSVGLAHGLTARRSGD